MSMWRPQLADATRPIYRAIADALAADVAAGRLAPGDRLPPQRELARDLAINVMTVSRAYGEAARRGLVEGEVGRGTFVRRPTPSRRPPGTLLPEEPGVIDLHFNLPVTDPSILDTAALLAALAADATADPSRVPFHTGYSATGLDAHRAAGADWLRRFGVDVEADRVLIAGGAQHAMTLAFASLTRPGDEILVEELTYPGMKGLADVLGVRLVGLPFDADGLDPDALAQACERGSARVLYLMPTVHNPTGAILGEERRRAIVEVARHHGLILVEDDTYGYLCPDAPPPLAALAPERTYYLTGASKSLSAGLRIGYLAAPYAERSPNPYVERLALQVAATSWMAAPLIAEIAARWIADGSADRMLAAKRDEAAARRAMTVGLIDPALTRSDRRASHLWLELPPPWRGADFVAAARRRGVAVTPAEAFVVGRGQAPHAVRLCLGTPPTRDEVREALEILAGLLAGGGEGGRSLV